MATCRSGRGWSYAAWVAEFECFEVRFKGVTKEDWGGGGWQGWDLDLAADEGAVNGFGVDEERIQMIETLTWASVVVVGVRASAVMSDHLYG